MLLITYYHIAPIPPMAHSERRPDIAAIGCAPLRAPCQLWIVGICRFVDHIDKPSENRAL